MLRLAITAILIGLVGGPQPSSAQTPTPTGRPPRPAPPTRDPHTPGYVAAKDLPDDTNAPATSDGNFILGPTHTPAPEMTVKEDVPQGAVYTFNMESADSKLYPGIAREPNTFGKPDPSDPAKIILTTSHPAPYSRRITVYIPKQYVVGETAPFIVGADGPDRSLFTALDNLIAQHRVPVMIAISISNGGGDAQGSERGLEYDTMSGRYAEFVETEVLPLVEKQYSVKLTKDPEGRATMGGSSGGSCALIMAWYHPELYHRVLTYSGTYVNQQWPFNPQSPHGAWEFHEHLIPNSPVKPIRIWMEVGDRDNFSPNVMRDNMHDWVVANERMAAVLAEKGYHYQFVFARNAGHTDRAVKQQTLPEALEYVWQGYSAAGASTAPAPASAPLTVHPLLKNVSWLEGAGGNSGVIVGKNGVIVIDAKISSTGAKELLADIAKLTPQPVNTVILTHSDRDHVNGIAAFPPGVTVVAQENNKKEQERAIAGGGKDAPPPDRLPTRLITAKKQNLKFDGESVQLLHWGPAHTAGDLVIYLPKEKIVFTGDLLTNRPDPLIHLEKNGSSEGWIASVKGMLALNADTFVQGHGGPQTKAQVAQYLQHAEEKRSKIKELVSQGKSLSDIKTALGDPPPAPGGSPAFATYTEVVYKELTAK